jgi:hypothetical protein
MAVLHAPGQQDVADTAEESPREEAGAEEDDGYETIGAHLDYTICVFLSSEMDLLEMSGIWRAFGLYFFSSCYCSCKVIPPSFCGI